MAPCEAAVDDATFEQLRTEIGDDDAFADFVQLYLNLLLGRLHDLGVSLKAGLSPWEPAANLAATSRMLGAVPLAEHLEQIRDGASLLTSRDCARAHLRQTIALVRPVQSELRRQVLRLRSNIHDDRQLA